MLGILLTDMFEHGRTATCVEFLGWTRIPAFTTFISVLSNYYLGWWGKRC